MGVAKTTRLITIVVVVSLFGILPSTPAASGAGQAVHVPWWGPSEMSQGWHIRIPVSVINPGRLDLVNATAGYDIPLGSLLTKEGWPSRGSDHEQPAWFSFDERSVRVVEYRALATGGPLDGVVVGPVSARTYLGDFGSRRPYDAQTRPDIHVDFVMPGIFKANSTRYFYVYLDDVANGPKQEAGSLPSDALLDARYWIGRGTTLYGKATKLILVATANDTLVNVDAYDGGRPKPVALGATAGGANAAVLAEGQQLVIPISDVATTVRVTADHPVVAGGISTSLTIAGVIPSLDGKALGRSFFLPKETAGYTVYLPTGSGTVTFDQDPPENLDPGTPLVVELAQQSTHVLHATLPVMVFAWPDMHDSVPLVSPAGTPLGSSLFGRPYAGERYHGNQKPTTAQPPCTKLTLETYAGQATIYAADGPTYYRGVDPLSQEALYPQLAGHVTTGPGLLTTPLTFSAAPDHGCPLEFHTTTSSASNDAGGSARIGGFGGAAGGVLTGPVGIVNETHGSVSWPVTVIALYNGTLLDVTSASGIEHHGLDHAQAIDVSASADAPASINASKPIIVLGTGAGAFFAGVDESLHATAVGPLDYRGYLIDIAPSDGSPGPMVQVGAPGHPTAYHFRVRDLAKDALGSAAPDTVQLTTDAAPPGWSVDLSAATVTLAGDDQKVVTLTVTPPADAAEGDRLALNVHATSLGNPRVQAALPTITILRAAYGVGMWFDRENGPQQDTFTLDPGATAEVHVVVKNLATVRDSFVISASTLSKDWAVSFQDVAGSLDEVQLEPGATTTLTLILAAPTGASSQSLFAVTATGVADAKATSQVTGTLRTRADVKIALTVDNESTEVLPGTNATFNLTLHNRGNDSLSASWTVKGALPSGWGPIVTKVAGYDLDEISGVGAQRDLAIELVVPVATNATRGTLVNLEAAVQTTPQFKGDAILTDSQSLHVLVAAKHALSLSGAQADITTDANGTVEARVSVENDGNGDENLTISPIVLPPDTSIVTPSGVAVAQGSNATLAATLAISPGASPGQYPVRLHILTDDGGLTPWDFDVTVPRLPRASLTPTSPTATIAGQSFRTGFELRNDGNVPLALPPRFTVPTGWHLAWNASEGTLAPGSIATATLTGASPKDTPTGTVTLSLDPTWASGASIPWAVRTVALNATATRTGNTVLVHVTNAGTGDATEVDVSLFVSGERVDQFVLPRIPPGGTADALLALPTAMATPADVRVDPAGAYGDAIVLPLAGPARNSPGPDAAVVLLAAVVAVAAAAWNDRRDRRR